MLKPFAHPTVQYIQQPFKSVQQNRMDVEAMLKPFARAFSWFNFKLVKLIKQKKILKNFKNSKKKLQNSLVSIKKIK